MLETLRGQVYHILEEGRPVSPWGYIFDLGLILLIALNVAATMAETIEPLYAAYGRYFDWFEALCVALFTVEYVARLWVAVDSPEADGEKSATRARLRHATSPLSLIDFLAIAPYYLSLFVTVDLRVLLILRLLRLFKLTRYWTALNLLTRVIRDEAQIIGAALFLLMVIVVLASGAMYLVEHRVQPEAFGSVPETMWWTVTTITTVGYGDIVPVTPIGKMLGGFISLIGIGMVAFPSGILAAGFAEQIRRGRRTYRERVDAALAKGGISEAVEEELEDTREELGLSEAAVSDIEPTKVGKPQNVRRCPHCGEQLPMT